VQDDDVLVGLITDGIVMNGRWIIKRWRVQERNQKKVNKKKSCHVWQSIREQHTQKPH